MKRIAVIDLGTNTFHLLITEIGDAIVPGNIFKETIPVKLGEGGINQGIINPDAFQRGIKAMERFSELIALHQVSKVKAMATAAIRSASNGSNFIDEIKTRTGIEIEMINGDKEAGLIYAGVREAVKMNDETSLIMDIGGGSVEFILCNATEIFWKKSYPIGAAKLMDQFHHSDPISKEEIEKITGHLDETLPELLLECRKYQPETLIGSAGAFETFEELVRRRFKLQEPDQDTPAKKIKLLHFEEVANNLLQSTHEQRSKMKGLIALRVDMIVVATIITEYMIRKMDVERLILSDYSLKEGILFDLLS